MQPGLAVGHGVNQSAALQADCLGDFLAGDCRELHQEFVGRLDAQRVMERGGRLTDLLAIFQRFSGVVILQRKCRLGVERLLHVFDLRAAIVHAVFPVRRRVELVRGVLDEDVRYAHQIEQAFEFPVVANAEAVEARNDVDGSLGLRALLAFPEVLQNAFDHAVIAIDMAADEGRRVSKGHVEVARDGIFVLGVLDEAVQVVANDLRHTSGRHSDHLRVVELVGVGEPIDHVLQATKYRRILGHRGGNRRSRLLEMARQVRAVIGHAALAAVDEGHGALEARGSEYRAERLAGLGGVHDKRFAGEVLFAVLPVLVNSR
ncbi:hypothetical protein AJ88_25155 [Mesorhizobium amorphae CCBAU 01583]|nr:hypothetical protein AJ88_25155 [Mesorhizobium amorphae CCBAU 01583]